MAVKMDEFIDQLYGKLPQDPNTITINPETFYNLKDVFDFLSVVFKMGIIKIYGDIALLKISIDQIKQINKYFNSMGFKINVTCITLQNNNNLPNLFGDSDSGLLKTEIELPAREIENYKISLHTGNKIYKIFFSFFKYVPMYSKCLLKEF
jgi:hypothetical protein